MVSTQHLSVWAVGLCLAGNCRREGQLRMCNPTAEALPLRHLQVIDANDSSQLVLNEGNLDSTFLTELVGYYLTIDAGTVSGPRGLGAFARAAG